MPPGDTPTSPLPPDDLPSEEPPESELTPEQLSAGKRFEKTIKRILFIKRDLLVPGMQFRALLLPCESGDCVITESPPYNASHYPVAGIIERNTTGIAFASWELYEDRSVKRDNLIAHPPSLPTYNRAERIQITHTLKEQGSNRRMAMEMGVHTSVLQDAETINAFVDRVQAAAGFSF